MLADAKTKTYKPMGRAVKAALGPDVVYIAGTLSGGGEYGFGYWERHKQGPLPAAGTLEAALLAQDQEYSFFSLKHDAPGRQLTTYAFEYKPRTGPCSEVVDGFLFLKTVNPPHAATATAATPPADEPAPATAIEAPPHLDRTNPAQRPAPARASAAALTLTGTVPAEPAPALEATK